MVYTECVKIPHYRLWGLVVEIKTSKFSIGTRVRKRTVFPLHAKSPHTLFSAPFTGIVLTRIVHTSFPNHLMSHSTTCLFTCYSVEFVICPETFVSAVVLFLGHTTVQYYSSIELRCTITSCPHTLKTCSIPWKTATQYVHLEFCTVVKDYLYCSMT